MKRCYECKKTYKNKDLYCNEHGETLFVDNSLHQEVERKHWAIGLVALVLCGALGMIFNQYWRSPPAPVVVPVIENDQGNLRSPRRNSDIVNSCYKQNVPTRACTFLSDNFTGFLKHYIPGSNWEINDLKWEQIEWNRKKIVTSCMLDGKQLKEVWEASFTIGSQLFEVEFSLDNGDLLELELERVPIEMIPKGALTAFQSEYSNEQITEFEIDILSNGTKHFEFEVNSTKDKDRTFAETNDGRFEKVANPCEDQNI